jgi:selenide,water dikinase
VLRGGAEIVSQAGAVLAGGHSIEDPEPKYGLAVTGVADPRSIITNAGGREGDVLVLTKPLGSGAVVTARKHGRCDDTLLQAAIATMAELNDRAAAAALEAGAHAMTDVTGYGLIGHLHHLCRESGLAAELDACAVPSLPQARPLLEDEAAVSGGTRRNAAWAAGFCSFAASVPRWQRRLLCDATTSGGLLVASEPRAAARLPGGVVGRLVAGTAGTISVR